jgi:hypothetical protein
MGLCEEEWLAFVPAIETTSAEFFTQFVHVFSEAVG